MSIEWSTMLVGAVIGAFLTLCTVLAARRDARKLAEVSGALRSPRIDLAIYGHSLLDVPTSVWFLHPGPPEATAIFQCELTISNLGDKATGDLLVTITATKGRFVPDEFLAASVTPAVLAPELRRAMAVVGNFCQASHSLPSMGPRGRVMVAEPLCLSPTVEVTGSTSVTFKDGVKGVVEYVFSFEYIVTVVVASQEAPPVARSFGVLCLLGSDQRELAKRIWADNAAAATKQWEALTSFQRAMRMFGRGYSRVSLIVKADAKQTVTGNGKTTILMAKEGSVMKLETVSPVDPRGPGASNAGKAE